AAVPAVASAQEVGQEQVKTVGVTSMHAKREAARRAKEAKNEDKKPALYPLATREEPEAAASRSGLKKLQKLQETYQKQDNAATIALANEIAGDTSNAYEKSFAYLLAGTAAADQDDQAAAADYFSK